MALAAIITITGRGIEADTVRVVKGDITRVVEDTGYVQPSTKYDLQATQNARVIQVPVVIGQQVHKGQVLVVLENLDLDMQIADTQAQLNQTAASIAAARAAVDRTRLELENAANYLERLRELFASGAVAEVDFEAARFKVETLEQSLQEQTQLLESARAREAGLNQLLHNLNRKDRQLTLQSPVEGVILSLLARQEEVVSPGTLLASVAMTGQLEVKADILSDDLGEVEPGQRVVITAPVLGGKVLGGEVREIYPQAEEKQSALGVIQRRVPVIISLEDFANLKPGYEVRVAIETATRHNVPVIPLEAVRALEDGGKEVMVVTDNRAEHRRVQTGISDRENIEVTGGLKAGEMLIRDGSLNIKENARVKGWW
ncbi:efflux RND transporter periplasmic adaptor subunit [Desulfallas thermosapovorans]|uniref:HlyD family secretion protein n=1 Tax=Desulfallas thermosapovorans DSM 6562 TaxID=1121431 RepID=A0A5S4ZWV3_9FIRM|nr:efflux RND transporter periplasmic adaptor subunit [Desulfallas thermosapovorans]TYO97446.1 HlyD family secretion protein [Desulfallas thermosapovorans DSM 6562]